MLSCIIMPKPWYNQVIADRILHALQHQPLGMTASDVARFTGLNRITVTKYLEILMTRRIVTFYRVGFAKVYRLRG